MLPCVLLMTVGAALPWVSYEDGEGPSKGANGFNAGAVTKFDLDGRVRASIGNMGITIVPGVTVSAGLLIVLLGAAAVLVVLARRPRWASVIGALAVALCIFMFLRITQESVAASEGRLNVNIGYGIWVVLAGAVLTLLAGLLSERSSNTSAPNTD